MLLKHPEAPARETNLFFFFFVKGARVDVFSRVQTPPRKSATLNQIGAYPSPMSLPRRGTSGEAHSESSLTPLRSDSMPRMIASGSLDEAMKDLDTAMETEPIPVSDPSVPLLVSLPLSELSEGNWTNVSNLCFRFC